MLPNPLVYHRLRRVPGFPTRCQARQLHVTTRLLYRFKAPRAVSLSGTSRCPVMTTDNPRDDGLGVAAPTSNDSEKVDPLSTSTRPAYSLRRYKHSLSAAESNVGSHGYSFQSRPAPQQIRFKTWTSWRPSALSPETRPLRPPDPATPRRDTSRQPTQKALAGAGAAIPHEARWVHVVNQPRGNSKVSYLTTGASHTTQVMD